MMDSRDGSYENSRSYWRAPPENGGRRGHARPGTDGPRGDYHEGDGGRPRVQRRQNSGLPRRRLQPRRRAPPLPPPASADVPRDRERERSQSRSRTPPPLQRREPARGNNHERCRQGLDEMQGEWVDKGGNSSYVVTGSKIKRDDGRQFTLHFIRGVIGWGQNGNYYVVPDQPLRDEVRWLAAKDSKTAFVWERPPSPSPERNGSEGGPDCEVVSGPTLQ